MTIASGQTATAADVLGKFVSKTGDAMAGTLTLAADPVLPMQAATKQYVDAASTSGGTDLTLSGKLTVNGAAQSTVSNGSLYIGQSDFRRSTFWTQGTGNQLAQFSRVGSAATDVAQLQSFYLVNHTGGVAGNIFNTQVTTSASNAPAGGTWNFLAGLTTTSAYADRATAGAATQVASYSQAVRSAVTGGPQGVSLIGHVVEMHDFVDRPSSTRGAALTLELDWAGNNVDDDDSTGVVSVDLSLANATGSNLLVGNGIGFYGNTQTSIKRVFDVNIPFTQAVLDTRDATQASGAHVLWLKSGHSIALSTDGKWAIQSDNTGIQFIYDGGVLGFWDIFSRLNAPGGVIASGVVSGSYIQGSATQGAIAAGTTQVGATVLVAQWNNVATVPSGSGVSLPAVSVGTEIGVWNTGANALLVYPPSGATIDALSANTAYSIAAGAGRRFVQVGFAKWYSS